MFQIINRHRGDRNSKRNEQKILKLYTIKLATKRKEVGKKTIRKRKTICRMAINDLP